MPISGWLQKKMQNQGMNKSSFNVTKKGGCLKSNIALFGYGTALFLLMCIVGAIFAVFGLLRSSEVYELSLIELQNSETATAVLGEPIEGGRASGSIDTNDGSGNAELEINVSGSTEDGKLYVTAHRTNGEWVLSNLTLVTDEGQRFDLHGG